MISEKYKCIFVHIPKVAGQSVENFFLTLHGLNWGKRAPLLLRFNPHPKLGPERLAHLTASEYTDCGYLTRDTFDDYFKFAFVRNPWERLVSEYRYGKYDAKNSFRDFVLKGFPEKDPYTDSFRHILAQYYFLFDDEGKQLVDFIGRFETLQTDFDFVCSKLGISDSRLPHVNSSGENRGIIGKLINLFSKKILGTKHYTTYYDEETKEIVRCMYEVDISEFGYEFGG